MAAPPPIEKAHASVPPPTVFIFAIIRLMILSDTQIFKAMERGEIRFQPEVSPTRQLQPASIDLRLATCFRGFHPNRGSLKNQGQAEPTASRTSEDEEFVFPEKGE
ncbi:MAG: 2'-deoxycytidine 5'-triphosphate deaminase [Coprothermobacterota bacterium]|nr:2'-deoxycytidine 5'-triphosphate deaminase [Coprothermobacterota bacterium]